MIVAVLTFIGVLAIVLGSYWAFVLRPEAATPRLLDRRLRAGESVHRRRLTMPRSEPRQKSAPLAALQRTIERAGVQVTVPGLLAISWLSGFIVALLIWKTTGHLLPAMALGAGALVTPYAWIRRLAARRMWKFEEQFPEAIELIARALRAGHAFSTALSMVADEIASPVGPEFKLLYERQSFGMPLPDALRALADRVPLVDTRFFVTAVLTQRESGGNLSGVLDNLAGVIRDRFKVKRQVRSISAHGRMTAGVLVMLPPVVALAQTAIAPRNFAVLMRDPMGFKLLVAAAVLQVVGMLAIRQIVKVEY